MKISTKVMRRLLFKDISQRALIIHISNRLLRVSEGKPKLCGISVKEEQFGQVQVLCPEESVRDFIRVTLSDLRDTSSSSLRGVERDPTTVERDDMTGRKGRYDRVL